MDLVEELMGAAKELSMERDITQQAWSRALVEGWLKDTSLGWCVCRAAGIEGIQISASEWDAIRNKINKLSPAIGYSSLRNSARVWIAKNARYANDALWDGKVDLAVRIIQNGGRRADARRDAVREIKHEERKADVKGRLVVGLRARDKRTDWKTVK